MTHCIFGQIKKRKSHDCFVCFLLNVSPPINQLLPSTPNFVLITTHSS